MASNTSISLGDHLSKFIEDQLSQGRYGSASEVVRAGLRLLEEHELKLHTLRAALVAGEDSGPSAPFEVDRFIDERRTRKKG